MWRINEVTTNEISKMTDIGISLHIACEADALHLNKTFSKRRDACAYVRHYYRLYLRGCCDNIHVKCRNVWQDVDLREFENREQSFRVISRFIWYALDPETPYPKMLYGFLRIQKEFRKILPQQFHPHYSYFKEHLDEMVESANYMHHEFTKMADDQLREFDLFHKKVALRS